MTKRISRKSTTSSRPSKPPLHVNGRNVAVSSWAERWPFGLTDDGDRETLGGGAEVRGLLLEQDLVAPAESSFIEHPERPLQHDADLDVGVAGGVRHPAQQAGLLVQLQPGRSFDERVAGRFEVPVLGRALVAVAFHLS